MVKHDMNCFIAEDIDCLGDNSDLIQYKYIYIYIYLFILYSVY